MGTACERLASSSEISCHAAGFPPDSDDDVRIGQRTRLQFLGLQPLLVLELELDHFEVCRTRQE
jgi:hypothetical protein